jgi:hypothetical protein
MIQQGDLGPEIAEGDWETRLNCEAQLVMVAASANLEDYGIFSQPPVEYKNAKRRGLRQPASFVIGNIS